ncbi:neuroendocrine convertase 1-like [Pollicipes pollicipes]|uniref:neuroendocrine convertase 1-like n=1 Tax=Pollicipes pollicipes TaxID=41117 RepID=UPI001884E01B|nr:neuroendocrine convertase 1-like [Pollicipes pollicipes]
MWLRLLVAALTWLGHAGRAQADHQRGHELRLAYHNEWAVKVTGGAEDALLVARQLGLRCAGHVKGLEHVHLLVKSEHPAASRLAAEHITRRLADHPKVVWVEQQFSKHRSKRDILKPFNDPSWDQQWYMARAQVRLRRGPQSAGNMHVLQAMRQGVTGRGVKIVIVDDGLEHNNTDLAHAYDSDLGWDVVDGDVDPAPRYDRRNTNEHGTKCAGIVSMRPNNGFCGVGIAPGARLGAVRLLDGIITDRTEAEAFSVFSRRADIMSVSWGPTDDGHVADMPGRLLQEAIETGIEHGRDGKGVIFVWANGNGGAQGDSCACDGYASSPFSLSVGSVDKQGRMPWYGEVCASTLAVTYAHGDPDSVVTTDLYNGCTNGFSGTSASAPMAASMVALMLEVNPELTWRDVQHIVVYTAQMEPVASNGPWVTNAAGLRYSSWVGFGLVDADAMVDEARRWNLSMSANVTRRYCQAEGQISSGPHQFVSGEPARVTFEIDCGGEHEVRHLEHVEVVLHLNYTRRGALQADLTSPQGTTAAVLVRRRLDDSSRGFDGFKVTSVATWAENPRGKWTLVIHDNTDEDNHGQVEKIKLILWGTDVPIHQMKPQGGEEPARPVPSTKVRAFTASGPETPSLTEVDMPPASGWLWNSLLDIDGASPNRQAWSRTDHWPGVPLAEEETLLNRATRPGMRRL